MVHNFASSLFCCCWLLWDLVVWPRLGEPFECQNPIGVCVSFSMTDAELCISHLFVWSNLNFLLNSQWISFPTQSCLVLHSLCANWLHLLIMWLMVSSLSPHHLHLLFCCVLSILALIWLVLMALFCAAIRRDFSLKVSFSSLRPDFLVWDVAYSSFKTPIELFTFPFCFLVIVVLLVLMLSVLFLVAVISLSSAFLCSLQVVVSMRQRYLQSS